MKERVKKLCKQKGVSMNQAEQEIGLAKGYISKLNNCNPSAKTIQKIADYFGVSVTAIIEEEQDPVESADVLFGIAKDKDVIEMIAKFEKLNSKKKAHVMELIDFLSEE